MNKRKILFSIFCLALSMGCTKDPKSVAPNNVYNSANYPTTIDGVFSVLVPAYSNFRVGDLYGFEFRSHDFDCLEHTADLAYNGDASWNAISLTNVVSSNNYANDLWTGLYTGIQETNALFQAADYYEQNYAVAGDSLSLQEMRGEAHFLRALYYFDLECLFGQGYPQAGTASTALGVPLITNVANSLGATQVARSTVSDCWTFIISELQQSATLLHGVVWDQADQGRATEWAAKSLLGKAYVFTQDWADAKTTLLDVISNSGKSLMPFSQYDSAFVGNPSTDFNEESIFEINVERDPQAGYGVFANNLNLTAAEGLPLGPGILGDDGYVKDSYCMGYGNEFVHDRNLARFGYTQPIPTLVANPNFNPNNPPSTTNSDSMVTPLFRAQNLALRTNGTVDPRLWINALQPWIDSVSNDGGQTWRPEVGYPNIAPLGIIDNYYGWSFRKYNTFTNNIFNLQAADGANIYILRLADVFLLYAEACANSGDNTDALEYINKVHRRAYNYPYNAPSPVDYASLTSPTKAAGDPVLGANPLYYERWAELMGEGHWWFDVCRWKIGPSEAAWYGKSLAAGTINFDPTKSYVLPIPIGEMQANTKMVQNPGY